MALQLIYTSASAALKPGVTGFATVAQHRGIRAAIVRAIEQRSGYLDAAAFGGKRPAVFSHRRIEAAGERAHVLTRVVASGSDYTGRNNHLAHHLVITEAELERLRVSPADVIRQMKWLDRWDGDPRYFSEGDEIDLAAMKPQISLPAKAWASWPKSGGRDAACAALPFNANETGDARSFFLVGAVEESERLLQLYGESLLLKDPTAARPAVLWQTPFTTLEILAEDAKEFQWIGCVKGSPRHSELLKQRRSIIDLTAASLTPATGELAEIARDPAVARRVPAPTALAQPVKSDLPQAGLPPPQAEQETKSARSKKRSYEEDMLAHIENADDQGSGRQKWLLPTVIALSVLFLAAVVVKVYNESQAKKARLTLATKNTNLTKEINGLRQRFASGDDVSPQLAQIQDREKDFLADPKSENIRNQLYALSDQLKLWQELKGDLAAASREQLQLKLSDEKLLTKLAKDLSQSRLPREISLDLNKELEALINERRGMVELLKAAQHKEVDPQRVAVEKIRLEQEVNGFKRPEVRAGMKKIFDDLFPAPKEASKMADAPTPKAKTEPDKKNKPKVIEAPINSDPHIALLQKLPLTYVIPNAAVNVFFKTVPELSPEVITELTMGDPKMVPDPIVKIAMADRLESGILNASAVAKMESYKIAGKGVYDAGSKVLWNIEDGALRRPAREEVPWKFGNRYLISFSKEKNEDVKLPPPLYPNLQLLSMPPALSLAEAAKMQPLLVLPANLFLARDGTKIVIKPGGEPDLRKLLGKLKLAVELPPGINAGFEITAPPAPALKKGDGSPVSLFHDKGTFKDVDSIWASLSIDLGNEVQVLQQQLTSPEEGPRLKEEADKWLRIASAKDNLSKKLPPDFSTLMTVVTYITPKGPGRWDYLPLGKSDLPGGKFYPDTILKPDLARPAALYFSIVSGVIKQLSPPSSPRIYLTVEDKKQYDIIEYYGSPANWVAAESWDRAMTAYKALLAAVPPTAEERKKTDDDKLELAINDHRWKNRVKLLAWFNRTLSPQDMESMKAYLAWSADGKDPAGMAASSKVERDKWQVNSDLLTRLSKDNPEKLSSRYTLIISFPFAGQQTATTAYLKWIEFEGTPEPLPALRLPQLIPRPGTP